MVLAVRVKSIRTFFFYISPRWKQLEWYLIDAHSQVVTLQERKFYGFYDRLLPPLIASFGRLNVDSSAVLPFYNHKRSSPLG